MNVRSIKETCLYVTDLDRCCAFYAGALGLPLLSLVPGRHVFFRAGSSVLLCFVAAQTEQETTLPPHGARGVQHFAFEVARNDYDGTRAAVAAAGIAITHDHSWPNGRRSFYFSDPDGHLAEVVEEGLWE
ncbi:MAG: glyoxalase [Chitinophagaceae bacterium]|nr:MAG: glyoxalase [Chitinophagaceae bacterium]